MIEQIERTENERVDDIPLLLGMIEIFNVRVTCQTNFWSLGAQSRAKFHLLFDRVIRLCYCRII
ncbi:MAG: hypothetical protein DYG89_39040 [Caldilinea sp. CFX5]|nr:hypothetical protein [Caldilinea sp. CFX5]